MSNVEMSKLTSNKTIDRIDFLDYAKCFGMLCIIWGHIYFNVVNHDIIYFFHIPLFFFMSGMVFNKTKYPQFSCFFKKRIKSLILPYLKYSIFFWIVWASIATITHTNDINVFYPLLQTFLAQGSDGFLVHDVPLWFIPCLFFMELFFYYMANMKGTTILLLSIILAIGGYFLNNYCTFFNFKLLPWSLDVVLLGIIFYALGFLLVKKIPLKDLNEIIQNKNYLLFISILLLITTGYIGHLNGYVSMGHGIIGKNPFVFYLNAIIGIFAFITLCIFFSKIKNGTLTQSFKWFGRNSFAAMAIHNPIKGFLLLLLSKLFHLPSDIFYNKFEYSFILFVTTLLFTIITIYLINKMKSNKRFS